ncbi:hypothetical protein ACTD5D_21450 [Nocardia takedensis]|uniref:hypothetical protein n=1 Tax=Nocardia takedensis TaxID=259390 RepID=UPI003F773F7A
MIVIELDGSADSCGYAVPYYELLGERPVLDAHHARQPQQRYARRVSGDSAHSIDGLPALEPDQPLPPTGQDAPAAVLAVQDDPGPRSGRER